MGHTEAIIQNLKDAGCRKEVVKTFIELDKEGRKEEQIRMLEEHRRKLLDAVHDGQGKIDCLDYLLYQMKKEMGGM